MAAVCARRTLRASASPATKSAISQIFGVSSHSAGGAKSPGFTFSKSAPSTCPTRSSLRGLLNTSRLPVELSALQSLMPLHSALASSLYTSLLSLHSNSWGCLSEGFATPL